MMTPGNRSARGSPPLERFLPVIPQSHQASPPRLSSTLLFIKMVTEVGEAVFAESNQFSTQGHERQKRNMRIDGLIG